MSVPTTVIFDFGNVLLDWDPRRLYRTLIDDPIELDHFLTNIASPGWNDAAGSRRVDRNGHRGSSASGFPSTPS